MWGVKFNLYERKDCMYKNQWGADIALIFSTHKNIKQIGQLINWTVRISTIKWYKNVTICYFKWNSKNLHLPCSGNVLTTDEWED